MWQTLRVSFFLISLWLVIPGCHPDKKDRDEVFYNAVKWMWDQQHPDGGWHSETHAVLKDGGSLTPYILLYLMEVPDSIFPKNANSIRRASTFIREYASRKLLDTTQKPDYPNYAAAYTLRVLHRLQIDTVLQRRIAQHLLQQQWDEHRGIDTTHLAYGGWGYGEPDLAGGETGHIDLSHTRRIAEALTEYRMEGFEGQKVARFLKGVQRDTNDVRHYAGCISRKRLTYDGGFVSSVVTLSTTKSAAVEIPGAGLHYPSYATATCDGWMTYHALGMEESKNAKDALQWIRKYQRIEQVDGLEPEDPGQWGEVMHYYHWAVRAEAMKTAGIEGEWKQQLKKSLAREQLDNGSFQNPLGGPNKEDDPLMATIFCVQAMTHLP